MTTANSKFVPHLRAEKSGNRNRDDFRVLMAGSIFCILLIMMQSLYGRIYDSFFADRPFVSATVEIIYVDDQLPPLIKYDADALQPVKGTWIASVYDKDGTRLNTRRGSGNYSDIEDEPKFWSWTAWFDNEASDPPAVPDHPFFVCVRYDVTANDSGVDDSTEKFCSPVYDPNNPHPQLTEIIEEEIIR